VLAATGRGGRIVPATEAAALWSGLASLRFGESGAPLARVPLTPGRIVSLEEALKRTGAVRHYGLAGNAAWIAGVESEDLHAILQRESLTGMMIRGDGPHRIGMRTSGVMEEKVKAAMDPSGKFPPL
jgi:hypothetical protein